MEKIGSGTSKFHMDRVAIWDANIFQIGLRDHKLQKKINQKNICSYQSKTNNISNNNDRQHENCTRLG